MGVINLKNTLGFGLDISRLSGEFDLTMAHMNILCKVKENFLVPISFGAESKSSEDVMPSIGFGGIYFPEKPEIYLGIRGYLSFTQIPNNEVSFSNISIHLGFKF